MPTSLSSDAPVAWRQLLRDLEVRPSKRMGQNFLTDRAIAERIVAAGGKHTGATIVEVGPGLGILTRALVDAVGPHGEVVAVELDRRLAAHVRDKFGSERTPRVVEGDILRQSIDELVPGGRTYDVIANLPYNITSATLRYFLSGPRPPRSLVIMVQDEVARRIVAEPPAMSILAVSVQLFGVPEIVFGVDRRAFTPSPRVDSAVLRIAVRAEPLLPLDATTAFFELVHAGFGQRRKQLLNSLAAGTNFSKATLATALARAAIAPTTRAQTLTVAEWLRVYHVLHTEEPA